MELHTLLLTLLSIAALLLMSSSPATVAGGVQNLNTEWRSGCQGSIGECLGDGEMEMDTESHRRILASTRYISYGAMQRNTVPCSRRGASYYNCRPGAQANPYSRGCSQITRCRR